jgi:hypothetical protein
VRGATTEGFNLDGKEEKGRQENGQEIAQEALNQEEGGQEVAQEALRKGEAFQEVEDQEECDKEAGIAGGHANSDSLGSVGRCRLFEPSL